MLQPAPHAVAQVMSPAAHRDARRTSPDVQESPSSRPPGPGNTSSRPAHQKLVFTDPVAFRYLEEDPSTVVLHRHLELEGYEIYIVEQWTCSRIHPTFVITTYTGDSSHKAVVGVLGVPTDESTWSPRLKLYFNAVKKCQLRAKETPLGTVMVTDLNSFPSGLTVIPVPDGNVLKHKEDFIVNENLKRLGCAGRAGLKLLIPSATTVAKFYQLYRTSERVPLYTAVPELVKQCQIALMMFGNLAPEYVDGLLCDVTEAAILDWWTDIGMDLYNIEPNDGALGPTTVAALLGTLMGARNRLHAFGTPVGKDVFDISNLKRGIAAFQKSQKLKRTRRLDRQTLDRLHRVTAKAAHSEGWTDAVKSTMAELSGHGGEMVMGMVRGREKGGIADVETIDIDIFAQLANGERAKWLWRGKPRKTAADDDFASGPPASDMMFTTDHQGGYVWMGRKRHSNEYPATDRSLQASESSWKHSEPAGLTDDKDQNLSKMVIRGVSGKVSDARIGFGKFRDAVGLPGLRSHLQRQAKEGVELGAEARVESDMEVARLKRMFESSNQPEYKSAHSLPESHTANDERRIENRSDLAVQPTDAIPPTITVEQIPSNEETDASRKTSVARADDEMQDLNRYKTQSTDASGVSGDQESQTSASCAMALRRRHSCDELGFEDDFERKNSYWPRHLSFSTVEEVVLNWEELGSNGLYEKPDAPLEEAIIHEDILASDARISGSRIQELEMNTVPWVENQVASVDRVNRTLYEIHEKLNTTYLERFGLYQQVREQSSDLLADEHSHLTDHMKRVEMLGAKLDYELHALESKLEDVETGLGDFERHVNEIETRIKALVRGDEEKQSSSWLSWLRRLAGLSTQ